MPIYTVTCRAHAKAEAEELFVDAASAGEAAGYAVSRGKRVVSVGIAPRGQIAGEASGSACRRCHYSLAGLPIDAGSVRCPECGFQNNFITRESIARVAEADMIRFEQIRHAKRVAAAAAWSAALAVFGLFCIGLALPAVALGIYSLSRSGLRHGWFGTLLGAVGMAIHLLSLILSLVDSYP